MLKATIVPTIAIAIAAGCQSTPASPPNPDLYYEGYKEKPQKFILQCMQTAQQTPQMTGGANAEYYTEMYDYWAKELAKVVEDPSERERLSTTYAPKLSEERAEELSWSQNFVMALGLKAGQCKRKREENEVDHG